MNDMIGTIVEVLGWFLAGGGWIMLYIQKRNEKRMEARAEAKEALYRFLLPLQAILESNRHQHTLLSKDPDFKNLEYAPDYVRQYFQNLSPDDPRRIMWRGVIDNLINNNMKAVQLLQDYSGFILSDELKVGMEDFMRHALSWAAMWKSVVSETEPAEQFLGAGRLIVPPFPESMDVALQVEINKRRSELERI